MCRASRDVAIAFCWPRKNVRRRKLVRWCELSTKSFLVHHTQLLAAAAQVGDAKGIRKEVTEKKMRLLKDALKATGRG